MSDSSKPLILKPASRQGIIPLLGIWGGTGGGKTESALRLARGIAGPKGRLGVVDTESKRANYYADTIPGSFNSIDFDAPYSPERYIECLDLLERNADVGVVDSISHCWEGPDGILDLHEQTLDRMLKEKKDNWGERERLNWPAWRGPKLRWVPLRNRLLSMKIPLIICFRGKNKSHMVKGADNKNTVVTDQTTSPIFEKDFIFEMHVAMEMFQKDGRGGFVRFPMPYAKTSHRDIRALLPKSEIEQISIEHGAALAKWCATPSGPGMTPESGNLSPKSGTDDPRKALKQELWNLTTTVHNKNPAALLQFLHDENIITDEESLDSLGEARLKQVIEAVKKKQQPQP